MIDLIWGGRFIKVIYKHGSIDPERTRAYKIVCLGCDCEFYASNNDFEWREKSIDGKAGILCPDCGLEIVFKPRNCMIDMREDPDCMIFQDNVNLKK